MKINAKSSSNSLNNNNNQRPVESVETAGSLAFNTSLFSTPQYDSYSSSNPFAPSVDYSNYSEGGSSESAGFLACFSNAMSTIGGGDCGFSGGFSDGGCSSSCSSGGFSSFV